MNCMNCGGSLTAGVKFCPRCGTPTPQPDPYGQQQQYVPPGGQMYSTFDTGAQQQQQYAQPRRKSRAGKFLLIFLGVILVLGAGAMAAAYFGYRYIEGTFKNSEPYLLAVQELRRNPVAAEHFGEINDTGFPLGNFNESVGGTGHAEFSMSVEGEKGSGNYMVTMSRTDGVWSVKNSVIRTPEGKLLNLSGKPSIIGSGDVGSPDPGAATNNSRGRANAAAGAPAISGGVLNGKAVSKPAPPYPAIAKAVRASGTVTVQVTVDEEGRVREARAVSGHPLLRAAAEAAAREARLTPTQLSGKPVKVTGVLTYDFKPE
ncbi:MAG TPA: TonB family protein [Pyrinomonadaceae bacterium]